MIRSTVIPQEQDSFQQRSRLDEALGRSYDQRGRRVKHSKDKPMKYSFRPAPAWLSTCRRVLAALAEPRLQCGSWWLWFALLLGCFGSLYGYIEYCKYMGWNNRSAQSSVVLPDMAAFLHEADCQEYAGIFEAEKINFETLLLMEPSHLKELGLKVGPRVKLERAIVAEKTRLWGETVKGRQLRMSPQGLAQLRDWGRTNAAKPSQQEV